MSASKNKVVVTSEQESEARECFAMFDSDNDGFILKKEVPMLFMSLGKNPTQKEINTLMAKHKSRRKDRVSVDEFIYLLKQGIGGSGEPGGEMMEGLKIYDDMMSSKPGTGTITEGELRHIMAKFGDQARTVYFILSGEVRVVMPPKLLMSSIGGHAEWRARARARRDGHLRARA